MNFVECVYNDGKLDLQNSEQKVDISIFLDKFEHLENGKKVLLGFRPEGAILEKYQVDGAYLSSVVELTEMLGDNTNVYAKLGEHNIILKIDPHDTPKIDDECGFVIPLENIYVFDKESGKVLNRYGA
jgi:multiple sugar transport system ATP-binding protein